MGLQQLTSLLEQIETESENANGLSRINENFTVIDTTCQLAIKEAQEMISVATDNWFETICRSNFNGSFRLLNDLAALCRIPNTTFMSAIHNYKIVFLHKDFGFVWLRVCPASLGGAFFKIVNYDDIINTEINLWVGP